MQIIRIHIVALPYYDVSECLDEFLAEAQGRVMTLRPDPANDYDVNAVCAYDWQGRHVGYVASHDLKETWQTLRGSGRKSLRGHVVEVNSVHKCVVFECHVETLGEVGELYPMASYQAWKYTGPMLKLTAEMASLDSVFYAQGCLEKMREERPGDYARLEMEVGRRYFAFHAGGREPARQMWSNAAATGGASGRVRKLSAVMCELLGGEWAGADAAERAEAWQFLVEETLKEAKKCGDGSFAAAVCGAAAGEAAVCADRYGESGKAAETMRAVTGRAEQLLAAQERGKIKISGRLREQLQTAVESAKRIGSR